MKRYRHILSFLLCLAPFTASAQHPTAHWARASSAAELAEGEAVAADISGNVYVTGEFNDSIIAFGNIVLYDSLDFQFFSKYNSAPFLVKYSSTGSVLWANSFSTLSTYDPRCSDVATDQKGYVYWALSTSIGYQLEKAVVLKYDSLGILLWQIETRTDSSFYCSAPKLALDKSGNIYMTGYFGGDSMVLGSHVLRNCVPGA
ncbi:MAG: hypothetical protein JWO03_2050, partial [Bacteroidetes bacterium]|nr:hypothetical protein [Bacteroidota bacterium]